LGLGLGLTSRCEGTFGDGAAPEGSCFVGADGRAEESNGVHGCSILV
jgi:hypothetical protein